MVPDKERFPEDLRFEARDLSSISEPAAVLDRNGAIVCANDSFSIDRGLLAENGAIASQQVLDAIRSQSNASRRIHVDGNDTARIFDLLVLPLADTGLRLVTAVERTVDVGLRNALASSRARFKTLVDVSSDYAWETAADGAFAMVTPKGLAGQEPRALIGRQPGDLLLSSAPQPAISPFSAPVPMDDVEVWLRHADGKPLCFEVSAVPLFDELGEWRGARGVCRDVTEMREHQRRQAEQRQQDRVFARITNVFRQETNPDDMLQMAASTSTHGFGAGGCQILTADLHSDIPLRRPPLVLSATFGIVGELALVETALDRLIDTAPEQAQVRQLDGMSVLMCAAVYSGRPVGAILLWRGANRGAWSEADMKLLLSLSGQIAAVIEQRASYRLLLDVSRTDPLTGLLNRRAFYGEMKRRFKRLQRDNRTGALVYLDLDNFKLVNDVHGHAKGDEALRHLADILRNNTRSTDLAARLGGDEFGVWLDSADEGVAIGRAQVFLAAARALLVYSGRADRPLKMSIGIAVHDPKMAEDINEFVSRADLAMYQVKRTGKGTFAMAAPVKGRR